MTKLFNDGSRGHYKSGYSICSDCKFADKMPNILLKNKKKKKLISFAFDGFQPLKIKTRQK